MVCNLVHSMLQQRQRALEQRAQLDDHVQRMRSEVAQCEQTRDRLQAQLHGRERELGALQNKVRVGGAVGLGTGQQGWPRGSFTLLQSQVGGVCMEQQAVAGRGSWGLGRERRKAGLMSCEESCSAPCALLQLLGGGGYTAKVDRLGHERCSSRHVHVSCGAPSLRMKEPALRLWVETALWEGAVWSRRGG